MVTSTTAVAIASFCPLLLVPVIDKTAWTTDHCQTLLPVARTGSYRSRQQHTAKDMPFPAFLCEGLVVAGVCSNTRLKILVFPIPFAKEGGDSLYSREWAVAAVVAVIAARRGPPGKQLQRRRERG